ncbi:MAG TPA: Ig-like domain-containing protein, partial [Polyangiaceae bacterium]|nr:Ig-like domain-containing protein [Polyangiaceae bacterium]
VIGVHSASPDTTPPSVHTILPADGASGQPVTSRVGVSFTDNVELATVDAGAFILRPVGGEPVSGVWSAYMSVLSFSPDEPLQPQTQYEVVLPAGRIKDYVGNGMAAEFRSTFTTR